MRIVEIRTLYPDDDEATTEATVTLDGPGWTIAGDAGWRAMIDAVLTSPIGGDEGNPFPTDEETRDRALHTEWHGSTVFCATRIIGPEGEPTLEEIDAALGEE